MYMNQERKLLLPLCIINIDVLCYSHENGALYKIVDLFSYLAQLKSYADITLMSNDVVKLKADLSKEYSSQIEPFNNLFIKYDVQTIYQNIIHYRNHSTDTNVPQKLLTIIDTTFIYLKDLRNDEAINRCCLFIKLGQKNDVNLIELKKFVEKLHKDEQDKKIKHVEQIETNAKAVFENNEYMKVKYKYQYISAEQALMEEIYGFSKKERLKFEGVLKYSEILPTKYTSIYLSKPWSIYECLAHFSVEDSNLIDINYINTVRLAITEYVQKLTKAQDNWIKNQLTDEIYKYFKQCYSYSEQEFENTDLISQDGSWIWWSSFIEIEIYCKLYNATVHVIALELDNKILHYLIDNQGVKHVTFDVTLLNNKMIHHMSMIAINLQLDNSHGNSKNANYYFFPILSKQKNIIGVKNENDNELDMILKQIGIRFNAHMKQVVTHCAEGHIETLKGGAVNFSFVKCVNGNYCLVNGTHDELEIERNSMAAHLNKLASGWHAVLSTNANYKNISEYFEKVNSKLVDNRDILFSQWEEFGAIILDKGVEHIQILGRIKEVSSPEQNSLNASTILGSTEVDFKLSDNSSIYDVCRYGDIFQFKQLLTRHKINPKFDINALEQKRDHERLNISFSQRKTLLMLSCEYGRSEFVDELLKEEGIKINFPEGKYEFTPLIWAVEYLKFFPDGAGRNIIQTLLRAKADPHKYYYGLKIDGFTVIHYAITQGCNVAVNLFLQYGINTHPGAINFFQKTCPKSGGQADQRSALVLTFELIIQNYKPKEQNVYQKIVKLFYSFGLYLSHKQCEELIQQLDKNSLELLHKVFNEIILTDILFSQLEKLISNSINVTVKNSAATSIIKKQDEFTKQHDELIKQQESELIEILGLKDKSFFTFLERKAERPRSLSSVDGNVKLPTELSSTVSPLTLSDKNKGKIAEKYNEITLESATAQSASDKNYPDKKNMFSSSTSKRDVNINAVVGTLTLFSAISDLNSLSMLTGLAPIHVACIRGNQKLFDCLVAGKKVDISRECKFKHTPLFYTIKHRHLLLIDKLVQFGAALLPTDLPDCCDTPLHALMDWSEEAEINKVLPIIMEYIFKTNCLACIFVKDMEGNTPFVKAMRKGFTEVMKKIMLYSGTGATESELRKFASDPTIDEKIKKQSLQTIYGYHKESSAKFASVQIISPRTKTQIISPRSKLKT